MIQEIPKSKIEDVIGITHFVTCLICLKRLEGKGKEEIINKINENGWKYAEYTDEQGMQCSDCSKFVTEALNQ